MRTSRFSPEQIIPALREAEARRPVAELCRQLNVGVHEGIVPAGIQRAAFASTSRLSPWSMLPATILTRHSRNQTSACVW